MTARLIVEAGVAIPAILNLDDGADILVGRNRDSHLFLQDHLASRLHARIRHSDGAWHIADQGTTNGTRIDGQRIESACLEDNQIIAIGDVRLRFRAAAAGGPLVERSHVRAGLFDESETKLLEADELSALLHFNCASLAETSVQGLVARALEVVVRQTGASLAGFLTLDAEHPDLRMAVPTESALDARLSKSLTEEVLRKRKMVWLGARATPRLASDSLSPFRDAICLPLCAAGAAWGQEGELPLGALHIYCKDHWFTGRQAKFCEIVAATLSAALEVLRARRAMQADNERLRDNAASAAHEMVGSSTAMARVRERVNCLAASPVPVLICGETGVGKELAALGLHQQSPRHAGPLVVVNCASLVGAAAEADLFGVDGERKTGSRPGFFAQAEMGTLFLDEVCELSLDLQCKLLRAVETRLIRPVNSRLDIRIDVRVIAATRREPEREVREGRLRPELFYRLSTRIAVPPLRERIDDLPELAQHFLEHLGAEHRRSVQLSPAALRRLMAYSWPGNLRQLRSVLEGAVANGGDRETIHAGDVCLYDLDDTLTEMPATLNIEQLEQWAIGQALRKTSGNVTAASQLVGLHRTTLHDKIKQYGGQ